MLVVPKGRHTPHAPFPGARSTLWMVSSVDRCGRSFGAQFIPPHHEVTPALGRGHTARIEQSSANLFPKPNVADSAGDETAAGVDHYRFFRPQSRYHASHGQLRECRILVYERGAIQPPSCAGNQMSRYTMWRAASITVQW